MSGGEQPSGGERPSGGGAGSPGDGRLSGAELAAVQRGLRMARPPDPERLAAEVRMLAELEGRGAGERARAYLKLHGPGYLQSAMTLGGGTAATSLFAGAVFGYQLLWVAPVAMLMGVVMLSAVSHQTLSTGLRPFAAMRHHAGAFFAWGWAIGALLSSVIWHFPQYSLAAACLVDMGEVAGLPGLSPQAMGLAVLVWAIAVSTMYGASERAVRTYERLLKYMVWGIVLCFALVVVRTGVADWGALLRGYVAFEVPGERSGVSGAALVIGGLSAAVGVNMVFLFPYSQLARGWGREHRRLARFDLLLGMFVPYALATSLMVIATANTIHLDPAYDGRSISPVQAAQSLATVVGPVTGRVVFNLGILGMALSSITLHMLTCGFVCAEVFGLEVGGLKYRLATLIPVPGVLGPVFWSANAVWLAVPTTILCGFLLPVAYVGFVLLQRNPRYLGDDRPRGAKGAAWLGAMVLVTSAMIAYLGWFAITRGPGYFSRLFP